MIRLGRIGRTPIAATRLRMSEAFTSQSVMASPTTEASKIRAADR